MEEQTPHFARAAIHGTAWQYLAFFSGKIMLFISTVVLARILSKDDFGVVGFAVTTIGLLDAMSDLGVTPALIYHPEDDDTTVTAFWLSLGLGTLLFVIIWFAAPLIGLFFNDPRAVSVTRVLALSYPINSLGSTQQAVLQKKLAFKRTFIPNLFQSIAKGLGSIILASLGLGVWSLIGGQLGGMVTGAIIFWFISQWRPSFSFNPKIALSLLRYGIKIVGVDILGIILINLDNILVGKNLGAVSLGVYALAFRIPDLIILQFARILSGVIFPIYTRMRDVPGSLTKGFSITARYVSLITVPFGLGLAILAKPFIFAVFTEKWSEAIPVVRAISIYAMLLSLSYNAGSVYKAQGRPQILTWLDTARLVILFPALIWATSYANSIVAVGWVQAIVAFLGGALNLFVAAKLLNIPFQTLFIAFRPAFLAGSFLACAVGIVILLFGDANPWLQLGLGTFIGAFAYFAALWIFQRDVVVTAWVLLRSALGKV